MATRTDRRYGPGEYDRVEGGPLPPQRLAQIWRTLPEGDRLGFIHSLDETIADQVITLTAPARPAERELLNGRTKPTALD